MATIHRLNSDWTLTDGIIDPIRLSGPMTIYAALRSANIVPDAQYGMNPLACEWIANRTFVYEKKFDLPPANDTERTELHFEKMFGPCTVEVNGAAVTPFSPNRYDVTARVRPADNLLRVTVAPEPLPRAGQVYARGISGSVHMQGANRITVHSAEFSAGDSILCDMEIDAHISGKYHITCLIACDGEAVATHEAHPRLIAARQDVKLEFPLPESASGMYDIQLTIEHNGLLCDRLRGSVLVRNNPVQAVCHIAGNGLEDCEESVLRLLPMLKDAGFDGVAFRSPAMYTRRIATRMQELGLTREADADAPAFTGAVDGDMLKAHLQGASLTAAWRLRSCDKPDVQAITDRFGKIATDDIGRWMTAIRLMQAQQVFDSVISARKAGEIPALACSVDAMPRFASTALADDSAARPALYAAKQALQPMIALSDVPDGALPTGEVLKLPILLISRKGIRPLPVNVTATMYDTDGRIISGTSFAAMPGGEMKLGELNCELPAGARCALLRTVIEQGGAAPIITDRFIPCGDKPLLPAELPLACAEDSFRYGVVTGSGIRCLLPGESTPDATGEYFNR